VALVGLLLGSQLDDRQIGAIRQGLGDAGYIEGRNLAIKYLSLPKTRFVRIDGATRQGSRSNVSACRVVADPGHTRRLGADDRLS
jgi:hypothetical protein